MLEKKYDRITKTCLMYFKFSDRLSDTGEQKKPEKRYILLMQVVHNNNP